MPERKVITIFVVLLLATLTPWLWGCTYPSINTLPEELRIQDERLVGSWLDESHTQNPAARIIRVTEDENGSYLGGISFASGHRLRVQEEFPDTLSDEERDAVYEYLMEGLVEFLPSFRLDLFRVDEHLVCSMTISDRAIEHHADLYQGLYVVPAYQFAVAKFVGDDTLRFRVLDPHWMDGIVKAKGDETMQSGGRNFQFMTATSESIVTLIREALESGADAWLRETTYVRYSPSGMDER
ncbi:MAG: hypothetical protein AAGH64_00870 [Planctomycetota bacterium]